MVLLFTGVGCSDDDPSNPGPPPADATDDLGLFTDAPTPFDIHESDAEVDEPDTTGTDANTESDVEADTDTDSGTTPGVANLRVLHLSPTGPAVDALDDGATITTGLAYGVGTPYMSVSEGDHTLQFYPGGGDLTVEPLLTAMVTLAPDTAKSAVLYDGPAGLAALFLSNDRKPPAEGDVRLRAVHTAAGFDAIDLYANGFSMATSLALGADTGAADVPAGAYTVGIDLDGDLAPNLECVLPNLPTGTIADVFVTSSGGILSLVVWFDDGVTQAIACATPVEPGTALFRVLHASPTAPPLDVFASGQAPVTSGLSFGMGTGYLTAPEGELALALAPEGQPASAALVTVSVALPTGAAKSAVVYDLPSGPSALVLEDDRTPPASGTLRIRATHAAPGVAKLDVYANGGLLFPGVALGHASTAHEVPAAAYTLGLDLDADGLPNLECALPSLPGGSIADVVATAEGGTVALLLWLDDGSTTNISCTPPAGPGTADFRVLHLSANAPAVDIFADGQGPIGSSLTYTEGTAYVTLTAGPHAFDVSFAGQPAIESIFTASVNLAVGTSNSGVALDTPTGLSAMLLTNDRSPPGAGAIRLRIVHAASDLGALALYANSGLFASPLAFGQASEAKEVPAGEYTIGVDTDANGTANLTCPIPALSAGTIADIFVSQAGDSVSLVAWFDDGTTGIVACAPNVGARLRVVHLSPDAPTLDAFVNADGPVFSGLAFGQSSDFSTATPVKTNVVFKAAGAPSSAAVVTVAGQNLADGKAYTVFAFGALSAIRAAMIYDDLAPVPVGQVRSRVVHAALGVGNMDIYSLPNPTAKVKITSNLAVGKAGPYLNGANSPTPLGIDANSDGVVDVKCSSVVVPNQRVVNVFVVKQGDALSLLSQTDVGAVVPSTCVGVLPTDAYVRAVHLSPGTASVDLTSNGQPLFAGVPFTGGTPYAAVTAGAESFVVRAAGQPSGAPILAFPTQSLFIGSRYTLALVGPSASPASIVLADEIAPPAAGRVRLRVVHAGAGVGMIDVYDITGQPARLIDNLSYRAAANALDLAAGSYTFGIDSTQDGSPDQSCAMPDLPAGLNANVFVVAEASGVTLVTEHADGSTTTVACTALPQPAPSELRVLVTSASTSPMDVYANGVGPKASGLAFEDGTPYFPVFSGTLAIDLVPAGGTVDQTVASASATLEPGSSASAIAYDAPGGVGVLVAVESRAAPASGKVRLRAVHAVDGIGALDVYASQAGVPGAAPTFADVTLGTASSTVELPAGQYTLGLDETGTGTIDYTCTLPDLVGGTIASLVVVGSGASVGVLVWRDNGSVASVACVETAAPTFSLRALHLVPDAPTLYATFAGTPLGSAVEFLLGASYTKFVVATDLFTLATATGSAVPVVSTSLSPTSKTKVTVVAFGALASPASLVLTDTDAGIPAGSVRLRAVHVAGGLGPVSVVLVSSAASSPLFSGLTYGAASSTLDVAAGTFRVGLSLDGDASPELVAQLPPLAPGSYSNLFVVRDAAGEASLVVQLPDGSTENAELLPFDAPGDALVRTIYVGDTPEGVAVAGTGPESVQALLASGDMSPWWSVKAGTYQAVVNAIGVSSSPTSGAATLKAGAAYTLVVFTVDTAAGPRLALALIPEELTTHVGRSSRIFAGHFARGLGAVMLAQTAASSQTLLMDGAFGSTSGFLSTEPGPVELSGNTDATPAPEYTWTCPYLPPGRTALALLAADADGAVRVVFATRADVSLVGPD